MLTVRFPNGQAVVYNMATYVFRGDNFTDIYLRQGADGKGVGWIAQVPNSCLLENTPAYRVYNALEKKESEPTPLPPIPLSLIAKEFKRFSRVVSKSGAKKRRR